MVGANSTADLLAEACGEFTARVVHHKDTLAVAGGAAALLTGGALLWRATSRKKRAAQAKLKPSVYEVRAGTIKDEDLKNEWDQYEASFGKAAGAGITDRSKDKVTKLVDTFYSMVTDFYEYGWGQSFHFSPRLPGKNWVASEAAHEARVAVELGLRPGMNCLDCGCGVGGPMRTIAAVSGAHITGITINQYQVGRTLIVINMSWLQQGHPAADQLHHALSCLYHYAPALTFASGWFGWIWGTQLHAVMACCVRS